MRGINKVIIFKQRKFKKERQIWKIKFLIKIQFMAMASH